MYMICLKKQTGQSPRGGDYYFFSGIGLCIIDWGIEKWPWLQKNVLICLPQTWLPKGQRTAIMLQVVGSVVEWSYQHPNYNQLDRTLGQICICGASLKSHMPNPSSHPTNKVGFKAGRRETWQNFFKKLHCLLRAPRNYRKYCNTVPSTFVQDSWTYLETLVYSLAQPHTVKPLLNPPRLSDHPLLSVCPSISRNLLPIM